MKKIIATVFAIVLVVPSVALQTPQKPGEEIAPEDVIRITTNLVQTDAVVTDKNDQIISDLKLGDFEVYDNGKKQDVKFMEFVSVETGKRVEGTAPALAKGINIEVPSAGVSAANLKRVIGFVVDDLTIPAEDMSRVRELLLDFVNKRMGEGDLVAIVRVIGGSGLLEQFTSDKQLLRNAIARLTPKTHSFSGSDPALATDVSGAAANAGDGTTPAVGTTPDEGLAAETQTSDVNKAFRTLMSLSTANAVVTSLRPLPGRKMVILVSGGLPLFEMNEQGVMIDRGTQETLAVDEIRPLFADTEAVINKLADNAARSGVVVNTMDVRGLQARPGVRGFQDTPAKSSLGMTIGTASVGGGGMNPTFGRTADMSLISGPDALAGAQGLRTVANATGGIASVNTNNFRAGLDKILARSQGYYLLGYSPSEKFDAKFHKIAIKVKREGAHVYARDGYFAREEEGASEQTSKENLVLKAAVSPLMKSELGVSSLIQHKFLATNKAELDIHLFIDPKTLKFVQSPDGKYQGSFDVVGFVFDLLGKSRGGFSETVNANLSPADYQKALASGLSYSAHTELPTGNYQLRAVIRENGTGRIGSISRYLEVPDLTKKQLTMSSMFLFAIDPNQSGNGGIIPLTALRQLSRKQDLRYAVIVYNPKLSNGQAQLQTQLIISQGSKVIFQEAEQPLNGAVNGIQIIKVGQLGLSRVSPGRYVLTLVVTDTLDKKDRKMSRSVDFTVVD
jgi:VWFA-related protein